MAYSSGELIRCVARVEPTEEPTWHKVGKRDMVANPSPDVVIPTWLFASFIGLVTGMIVGPAIMATTAAGSERLAELRRRYVDGR